MDWLVDLESTCSALGTADGKEYVRDEQCEEGVKDLIRFVSDSVSYRGRVFDLWSLQSA